jgi:hypothetical protein
MGKVRKLGEEEVVGVLMGKVRKLGEEEVVGMEESTL